MANSWFSSQLALRRLSKGVRRFLSTVADEMMERVAGNDPAPWRETPADGMEAPAPQATESDNSALPVQVLAAGQREQRQREAEAALLETWKSELAARLAERQAKREYFEALSAESQERFRQRLAAALAAQSGSASADTAGEDVAAAAAVAASVDAVKDFSSVAGATGSVPEPADAQPADRGEQDDCPLYQLPDTALLNEPALGQAVFVSEEELERQKAVLQATLDSFSVDALVYDTVVGPRITQFRVQPGTGVRVEAIASLERNICLALASTHIRIQAPIPGEPFVGIEVGNANAFPVQLRSLLESRVWKSTTYDIPLVLGMDIQGKIVLMDLARAPHLLIAGATGSGKSVCMSNLVLSLLYRFTPAELELIMIDPKRVEFGLFKDVPHLIHPVVTEPKMAVQVLKWVVQEMQRRYEVLAGRRVRNLAGYNAMADREGFARMPFMVVILDELADLMMTSKGEAEEALARIAQLSRAVGIHTIIATQRPSVNVITGIIKANYPTRIAFQVSSQIDSRTILDSKGAESLLGRGDMLFNPPGVARLLRIQSPLVEDEEILRVVAAVGGYRRNRDRVEIRPEEQQAGDSSSLVGDGSDDEQLVRRALAIIAQSRKASTSYLQRRLRIGYNRAATIMEELEDRGWVGPQVGTNPREIFVEPDDLVLR